MRAVRGVDTAVLRSAPLNCAGSHASCRVSRPWLRSFHRLCEFSGTTRSCKRQLEVHNARRRKAAKGAAAASAEAAASASSVGHDAQPEDGDAAADAAATLAAPPGAGGFK